MPLVSKMMSAWQHVLNIFKSCNLWQHIQIKTIIIHPLWISWDSWGSVTPRGSLNCSFRRKDKVGVPLSPLVLETMTWWQPWRANGPGWTFACLPLFQTPTQSHWLPNKVIETLWLTKGLGYHRTNQHKYGVCKKIISTAQVLRKTQYTVFKFISKQFTDG